MRGQLFFLGSSALSDVSGTTFRFYLFVFYRLRVAYPTPFAL